jgi:hypothetical protein
VWRKPGEELRENNFLLPIKYGCGSVTVWGCMEASGVGNLHLLGGIMNKHFYVNVFRGYLKASAENLGIQEHFEFYHANCPNHSAHLVREWCLYNYTKVIKTPPQSPNLNAIENLRAKLEKEIRNREDLKNDLREEWERIRLKEVIVNR